jgi:hypothetical protein
VTFLLLADLASAGPYAVVVGTDTPPPGRTALRYARTDAEAVRDALVDVGGFDVARIDLLLDPTPDEVLAAIAGTPNDADTFLLYFSGHADTDGLFPAGRRLSIHDLKEALDDVPAQVRIGIVDSCHGGGWTGTKGVTPVAPFEVPSLASAGTAYIAASSGAEDAHELEALGGSVFTHHWVAGLRGAADADADAVITLGESFDWARSRTIRDSTVLAGRTQHPSFHLDVRGRQDVVPADLRGTRSAVSVAWDHGQVAIHALDTGIHVADLRDDRQPVSLVLPPGPYVARRTTGGRVDVAEFVVQAGTASSVSPDRFVRLAEPGAIAMKGDELAEVHRMSPSSGSPLGHVAVGSWVGPSTTGDLERRVQIRMGFAFGITDRVSLAVPGLGVRIGRPEALETLLFAGFYDGGPSIGWQSGGEPFFGLYGDLGGGIDLRRRLSPTVGMLSSAWAMSPAVIATDDRSFGALRHGAGVGAEIHLGPGATLRPSAGGEQTLGDARTVELVVGGSLRRGVRPLPLLQLQISKGMWLDLDYALRFDSDDLARPVQESWLGITTTFDSLAGRE